MDNLLTTFTQWKNGTDHTLRFRVMIGVGKFESVVFKTGDEKMLPAYLDHAIQKVEGGVIVGGLAPLLTKVGSEAIPMSDALARASKLGEDERKLMLAGIAPTMAHLEGMAKLSGDLEALKKQLAAQQAPATPAPSHAADIDVLRAEIERMRAESAKQIADLQKQLSDATKAAPGKEPAGAGVAPK